MKDIHVLGVYVKEECDRQKDRKYKDTSTDRYTRYVKWEEDEHVFSKGLKRRRDKSPRSKNHLNKYAMTTLCLGYMKLL